MSMQHCVVETIDSPLLEHYVSLALTGPPLPSLPRSKSFALDRQEEEKI